ncbi:MAG: zinc ribbon domain-containing protein [Bdellovibrionales bacterium]|nr:zinc ribbon domain-containing protein [Bdellovibrionales bacterium]
MPIYEYECISKGHRFEEMQKISDQPLEICKVCGGKVKKLISNTAFSLKGSGWYKDGYSSSTPASAKAEAKPAKAESTSTVSAAATSTPKKKEKLG